MPSAATLRSRAAVAAAACLAVLAAAALLHRRRRRKRLPASPRRLGVAGRRGRPRRACEEEEKPQARFKRVLADNSYSPFKHLRRRSAQLGGAEGEAPLAPSQGARSCSCSVLVPACGGSRHCRSIPCSCFRNSTGPLGSGT
jgi:cation-transporting P-type ATPase D